MASWGFSGDWWNPVDWAKNLGQGVSSFFGGGEQPAQQTTTPKSPRPGDPSFVGPLPAYGPPALVPDTTNKQVSSVGSSGKYMPSFNKKFSFDENAARSTASSEFGDYYAKQAERTNKQLDTKVGRADEDYNLGKGIEDEALRQSLEQTGILRNRTVQDVQTEMDSILAERGETRATTAYDRVKQIRELTNSIAQRGLQFGGMAAQEGSEATQGRNLAKDRIERVYKGQQDATQLKSKRILGDESASEGSVERLGDLGIQERNRKKQSEQNMNNLNLTKSRTLEDIQTERENEARRIDEERKYKIEEAVNSRYDKAYQSWDMELKQFMAKYGFNV